MDISVVICTKNRAKHLSNMLSTILEIKAPEVHWEVIFVDNGSSDNTSSILHEFCQNMPVPARVIFEATQGLSAARNAGWKAAIGKIIAFTDDDCYPNQDWLSKIKWAFQNLTTDYVGGRVLLFDLDDAPVTIQTSEEACYFPKNSHIESGHIIGANFSCKRKVLEATGGFDQRLGAGTYLHSGEDTDLLIRASLYGFEGYYEPSVIVYHHHRRRLDIEVKKLYSGYALGRGALSMKTIIESEAKILYLKNWYWRICSLARKGKFFDCLNEIRGGARFISVSKLKASPVF